MVKKVKPMEFNKKELKVLKSLNTSQKIQSFLNKLPFRFEKNDTYNSPRKILREKKAHCFDGALLAAAALWVNVEKPLLLDLKVS